MAEKEYIDRVAAMEIVKRTSGDYAAAFAEIRRLPTADVVEAVHSAWKLGKSGCIYFCTKCEYFAFPREVREWNYCPNCGAKMDAGEAT